MTKLSEKFQTVALPKARVEQAKRELGKPNRAPLTKVVDFALDRLLKDEKAQEEFKAWLDRETA